MFVGSGGRDVRCYGFGLGRTLDTCHLVLNGMRTLHIFGHHMFVKKSNTHTFVEYVSRVIPFLKTFLIYLGQRLRNMSKQQKNSLSEANYCPCLPLWGVGKNGGFHPNALTLSCKHVAPIEGVPSFCLHVNNHMCKTQ